jgi:hypothetical protein
LLKGAKDRGYFDEVTFSLRARTWICDFVIMLAKETGWSEEFIFVSLPLSRALQYRHAILRRSGLWTLKPSEAPETQLSKLKAGAVKALGALASRFIKR